MKKSFIIPLTLLALAASVAGGCKKEETTKSSLDGSLSLVLPKYVEPGFTKTFFIDTMTTLTRPDGAAIGYYFSDPFLASNDTIVKADGSINERYYEFTVLDTIGVVNLSFGACSSDDYYGSIKTASFTVVRKGSNGRASITGFDQSVEDERLVDMRDLKVYPCVNIDGTLWMRSNLAWEGAGKVYEGYDVMSDIFGRYYTWEEAQSACPEGWRLPDEDDWLALASKYAESSARDTDYQGMAGNLMADLYYNGTRMWEYSRYVKVSDKSHLSLMPSGYAMVIGNGAEFSALYEYAALWTADEGEGGEKGVLRYIYRDNDNVFRGLADKTNFAASVRCVKSE